MERNSFLIVPKEVVANKHISTTAKLLFAQLCDHRNRRTGQCNPKHTKLAEELGIGLRTVERGVAALHRQGLIAIHRSQVGSWYEIPNPPFWRVPPATLAVPTRQSGGSEPPHPLYEPYIKNLTNEPDAAAACSAVGAAAAATCTSCIPETPTPPAPEPDSTQGGSPEEPAFSEPAVVSPLLPGPANEVNPRLTAAEQIAGELMANHPEPGNLPKAVAEAGKLLASLPQAVPATLEALRVSHAAWRERWAGYGPGRFIPQLWRWIHDGDWRQAPVGRKEVKSETWIERRKREYQEAEESSYRSYAEAGAWEILREYGGDELVEKWRAQVEVAS